MTYHPHFFSSLKKNSTSLLRSGLGGVTSNVKLKTFLIILSFFILPVCLFAKSNIKLGIDVLEETNFEQIRHKKIALFTNFSGRDSKGTLSADILADTKLINLKYIFTPEHGLYGAKTAGEKVGDDVYRGIPVVSLYGENRIPQDRYIKSIDAVVVDIQDIGVRSYTFISSVYYILQACARSGKKVFICDRPNPLGCDVVDGGTVQPGFASFVSIVPISYIHGMTLGELSKMMNEEGWLGTNGKKLTADLEIIQMGGYNREMTWEETGLSWYPTSPNVPSIGSVRGIASLGIIGELSIASVGIGTASPFCYIGLSDPKFLKFGNEMKELGLCDGVKLACAEYSPFFGFGSGKLLHGFYLSFNSDQKPKPYQFAVKCLIALEHVFPSIFDNIGDSNRKMFQNVTGCSDLLESLKKGMPDDMILMKSEIGLDKFLKLRQKYLLYE